MRPPVRKRSRALLRVSHAIRTSRLTLSSAVRSDSAAGSKLLAAGFDPAHHPHSHAAAQLTTNLHATVTRPLAGLRV